MLVDNEAPLEKNILQYAHAYLRCIVRMKLQYKTFSEKYKEEFERMFHGASPDPKRGVLYFVFQSGCLAKKTGALLTFFFIFDGPKKWILRTNKIPLKKRKSLPKFACIIWFTNDDYAVQMAI
jgi:hypothetical protein